MNRATILEFAVSDRSAGIPIHSATPETFTIGDGTQGDHDLAPQGYFSRFLRNGTGGTDGFHTILYGCISGAGLRPVALKSNVVVIPKIVLLK